MRTQELKLSLALTAGTRRKLWDLRDALKKAERRLSHAK